jgi:Uma2 family endonuclease
MPDHPSERPPRLSRPDRSARPAGRRAPPVKPILLPASQAYPPTQYHDRIIFRTEEPFEEHVAEGKRHLEARTTLYLVLKNLLEEYRRRSRRARQAREAAIGSDQFVYYDSTDPKKCFAPDVFIKLGSHARDFNTWNVWEQGTPDLVVEIVSDNDRDPAVWNEKFHRFLAAGVKEVVRFDALADHPIRIWDRTENEFVERNSGQPERLQCKTLGLYWIAIPNDTYGKQLRLAKDAAGKEVLPTPIENELRLEQELAEERRARASAEHERLIAEQSKHEEAEARKQLEAEVTRLRAELDQLRQTPR